MTQNHPRSPDTEAMSPQERRSAAALALIFFLRMAGLFMILPVFALYAEDLAHSTPLLIGIALGAYGLTQALLQIPFGALSDRFGRKPVIAAGLLLFALGSVVAALSDSIHGVILGRLLQGAGAIAAAVMALAADLTRDEQRSKAMALIGISIGLSFLLAFAAGPLLNTWIGVPGIFWLAAGLGLTAILVLFTLVPQPVHSHFHRDCQPAPRRIPNLLGRPELLRLNTGILVLHMVLTASFVALPLMLRDLAGLAAAEHWRIYIPVLVLSVLLMLPFLSLAERGRRMKPVFMGAVALLALVQALLWLGAEGLWTLALLLTLFFAAFNFLEATLPSLVSRAAPADARGTALGIYSTSQFIGTFCGGLLGGWMHGRFGIEAAFVPGLLLTLLWLAVAATMRPPPRLANQVLQVGRLTREQARQLAASLNGVNGVREAVVVAEDGVAYLKVDPQALDQNALREISAASE